MPFGPSLLASAGHIFVLVSLPSRQPFRDFLVREGPMASDEGVVRRAVASYDALLVRHPMMTNMVMSGSINATSETLRHFLVAGTLRSLPNPSNLGRQFLLGSCLVAPIATAWFTNLERVFRGWNPAQPATVLCKTACEQALFGPFLNTCFMVVQGMLEKRRLPEILKDIQQKFWEVQRANMCVWGPANLVSYKFVPPRLRILFANFVAVFWMLFLTLKTSMADKKLC
mmetsp:Transcript_64754/g.180190  ORF Transcript_64754/g.180190 Transcript_64754/m.180190 type:complete len:228 (+) Transcript_64754:2-685(+)